MKLKNPRQSSRQSSHQSSRQNHPKNPLNSILLTVIVLCAVGVIALLFSKTYFAPENQLQRELEALATDYYENYLYENYFLNVPESDRTAEFEQYLTRGMEPIYLRELLSHAKNLHPNSAQIFQSAGCDTNSTSVKYFPDAPYEKSDFHAEYKFSCEALDAE